VLVVRHGQAISNFLSDTLGPDIWFTLEDKCAYDDKNGTVYEIFDASGWPRRCLQVLRVQVLRVQVLRVQVVRRRAAATGWRWGARLAAGCTADGGASAGAGVAPTAAAASLQPGAGRGGAGRRCGRGAARRALPMHQAPPQRQRPPTAAALPQS
jgi:hypothetical protein